MEPRPTHLKAAEWAGKLTATTVLAAIVWFGLPFVIVTVVGYIRGEPTIWERMDNLLFGWDTFWERVLRAVQVLATFYVVLFGLTAPAERGEAEQADDANEPVRRLAPPAAPSRD